MSKKQKPMKTMPTNPDKNEAKRWFFAILFSFLLITTLSLSSFYLIESEINASETGDYLYKLSVYTPGGKLVYTQTANDESDLKVRHLHPGKYSLQISDQFNSIIFKGPIQIKTTEVAEVHD